MTDMPSRPTEADIFLEEPPKKKMSGKKKWLIAFLIFFVASLLVGRANNSQSIPDGYNRTICAADESMNLSDRDMDRIPIKLASGGFHGLITLPLDWGGFTVVLSTDKGDWASVWCNGHPEPGPIRFGYQRDEDLGGSTQNCYDPASTDTRTDSFWVQGQGTLTLVRTRKKHFTGIPGFGELLR